jgi:hypothetical protein
LASQERTEKFRHAFGRDVLIYAEIYNKCLYAVAILDRPLDSFGEGTSHRSATDRTFARYAPMLNDLPFDDDIEYLALFDPDALYVFQFVLTMAAENRPMLHDLIRCFDLPACFSPVSRLPAAFPATPPLAFWCRSLKPIC